jgi:DNA (cytosine-5)-methyltransferase 1
MLASRVKTLEPRSVPKELAGREPDVQRNLRWAVGDLAALTSAATGYDTPPRASEENRRRMRYLLDNNLYDLPNAQRPKCHHSHSCPFTAG